MPRSPRGARRRLVLLLSLALPLLGAECPRPYVGLVPAAEGFELPVFATAPAGDPRLFVVEQRGRVLPLDPVTGTLGAPFLDIRSRVGSLDEQGLWSLAFAPDYAESGHFYVYYQNGGDSVVSRFVTPDPADGPADPASELELLRVSMGGSTALGGGLQFGPHDGMLYVGVGEGGYSATGSGNAQLLRRLRGKILRIDVRGGPQDPYTIPADNPYVSTANRGEIWAVGVHDPARMDFDPITGDLWVADRGLAAREEIHVLPAGVGGLNLGWPIHEGSLCMRNVSGLPCETPATANRFSFPLHEYAHGESCRVVGALMLPNPAASSLLERPFLFADACSERFFVLLYGEAWDVSGFAEEGVADLSGVAAVSRDGFGQPYVVNRGSGSLLWLRLGPDSDADGIVDLVDNCPLDPNRDQADEDQDGEGDVCDEGGFES